MSSRLLPSTNTRSNAFLSKKTNATETMTMGNEETYRDRYNKRVRQENQAFEADEQAKLQRELDWHWQCRLDAEAAMQDEIDGWIDVGGFRERPRS
jgi:hypothetical protein